MKRLKLPFEFKAKHTEDQVTSILMYKGILCENRDTISIKGITEGDARGRYYRDVLICECGYPLMQLTKINNK